MRILFVIAGLSLVFIAFLFLVAKPISHVSLFLPPAVLSHNLPYFLYVRGLQKLFGTGAPALMIANGFLMLLTCGLVFRVGWALTDPRYRLPGAAIAMVLCEFNPLVIILPLTLGYLGGYLLVPLFVSLFI